MADKLVSVNDDYDFPAPVAARQAARLGDGGTAEGAAVQAAAASVIGERDRWDTPISKLDMRTNEPLVIAQCSDSTGYRADQFFELGWSTLIPKLWPDRPARVKRWLKESDTYSDWEQWHDGSTNVASTAAEVYKDSFTTDRSSLIGITPAVGGAYGKHPDQADTFFTTTGGRLVRGNGDTGTRATLRSLIGPREDRNWRASGTIKVPSSTSGEVEIMMVVGTESTDRVVLNVGATGNATLTVMWGGDPTTAATLGTLTGAVKYGADLPFALSLTGTTLSAALNGVVASGTVSDANAAKFASNTATRLVLRSMVPGTEWDDLKVTGKGRMAVAPDGTPGIDFYNGGASGTVPSYHLARLAQMYPVPVDLLIMNHMHNFPDTMSTEQCLAAIQQFVDALTALHGKRPGVIVNSQNPRFGTHAKPSHEGRVVALRDYAHKQGWGYIPSYEAFAEMPDRGRSLLVDDLHPAIGTGRVLQRDVFIHLIEGLSKRWTVKA